MREQLERALREHWTRENLTVYGDYLQSQDDLRGHLIALDLHAQTHGVTPDVEARRREILIALVGLPYLAALEHSSVELGFITDLRVSPQTYEAGIEKIFATPLGSYVRSATISGEKTWLKKLVTMFGRYQHPWLKRLDVVHRESYMSAASEPFISAASTKKLVAATPALELFVISQGARDRPIFPPFQHPANPRVQVLGFADRDERKATKLHIEIDGQRPDRIELSRTVRMITSTDLSPDARLAWLDLMIFLDGLTPGVDGDLPTRAFPAETLDRALAAIDFELYYGKDWVPVRDKLRAAPARVVKIARLSS